LSRVRFASQGVSAAERLRRGARILRKGGVLAYPTEGVYGLGCDPFNFAAVQRIWDIKGRAADKGLIIIGATLAHFEPLLTSSALRSLANAEATRAQQPASQRSTTWVVHARSDVPMWLSGGRSSLAVRLTRHGRARALCCAFRGALVSTSANISGARAAHSAQQARRWLPRAPDWILGGQVGGELRPSRIVELESGRVLRD
jgi:L-threonylcarbamoyladenylate synthase